eukprot:scaffold3673_cov393-Prasinococcus_capsulatus_cf.AAC.16
MGPLPAAGPARDCLSATAQRGVQGLFAVAQPQAKPRAVQHAGREAACVPGWLAAWLAALPAPSSCAPTQRPSDCA